MERFGETADREPVERATLAGGGLTAKVISWGAVLQDLRLEGRGAPLVLGFETFDPYPAQSPYFGAIAGRYANRIASGRFEIDGRTHQLDQNFLGKHTLHGGAASFGKRVWRMEGVASNRVVLSRRSNDGEMGFPGALEARCVYELLDVGRLRITLEGRSDAPTICSLAHHSYFNLDDGGRSAASAHQLRIDADAYLPVDSELIPTGEIRPVDGTDFDFRASRVICDRPERPGYDHNFCLGDARGPLRLIGEARGVRSGVAMEVWSTEPGLQFYDGAKIGTTAPGLDGIHYGPRSGFCLEAQNWPDAPNHSAFPDATLRPGETYRQVTEYRFTRDSIL